ncbi:DNA-directed RNA polymerase subunit B'' [archaeon]|jgi:DNA-directed RNA polymerase subunit B|nr:DNA-directed RNA polymerase subunit B'' [archaeon]MBT4021857.1 DNA-directed RNA polymerase subunit B'' [archaeon]MBT4272152.1 DNA-directed RNA polymerase subunit B'' [archaeon]MBT4460333.1 DNA-directed RNA polymerase subunit B'' [archaeon]MBT4858957.1 DNA-directed RNA polymerase subunit B'' [archaeon]
MNPRDILIKKYFENTSLVSSDIESFDRFIEFELQKIVDENGTILPTIIPHTIDEFKIKFGKITIGKPEITEADGSKRPVYPIEGRLRKISYAAPLYIEISAHVDGIQRESFTAQIGNFPIMLKSKFCHLYGKTEKELIELGEDPFDPGGYFIVNGTEKVLINVEDLAPNKMLVEKNNLGPTKFTGKLFSEHGAYKIPHTFEKLKDDIFYLSFTRVKRVPLVVILKALGMIKDEEIMTTINSEFKDEVYINLFEHVSIKSEEEALDFVAKKIGITQAKEIRIERMKEILDKYLLPHLGTSMDDRMYKAKNLCKLLKKYIAVSNGKIGKDDKDHYMNKRLKLSGVLLSDLFRVNLKVLIGDLLYNFQRIVKRGKFPSIKVIIRDKLLTQRIYSSMATGNWVGGRKGIAQRMQRLNYLESLSHLQRVVSPLSASQENFDARALHSTHLGRLCPIETPEGTNIGLRKNLALLTQISQDKEEDEIVKILKTSGVKLAR